MRLLSPPHRHLELRPGQPESVYVRRDFQITNVALGEELTDSNGRSVVKVTHSPINPVLLESDDEDSDDEDFDESEDEEDEDEESQDEVVQKAAKGGKKAAKEGKTVEEVSRDDVFCSCRRDCHSFERMLIHKPVIARSRMTRTWRTTFLRVPTSASTSQKPPP
jgi:hypothetical protein